jgi:hypothetical protein
MTLNLSSAEDMFAVDTKKCMRSGSVFRHSGLSGIYPIGEPAFVIRSGKFQVAGCPSFVGSRSTYRDAQLAHRKM